MPASQAGEAGPIPVICFIFLPNFLYMLCQRRGMFMKNLWDYISGESKIALTMKQVVLYLTVVMACIHTLLFILFLYFDVYMMAAVNTVSISLYAGCFIWLRLEKSPYVVFNLCYAEVIIFFQGFQALCKPCCVCTGYNAGFCNFKVCKLGI